MSNMWAWIKDFLLELEDSFTIKRDTISLDYTTNLVLKTPPNMPLEASQTNANALKLYNTAKGCLGQRMTLNYSVPAEVGCAEAVSAVLRTDGISVPSKGIAGTSNLLTWLKANPLFQEITTPDQGCIIISATGTGNGKIVGHVGIVGLHGIMSNDSNTGLFLELWTLDKWDTYYHIYGGIPTRFFALK